MYLYISWAGESDVHKNQISLLDLLWNKQVALIEFLHHGLRGFALGGAASEGDGRSGLAVPLHLVEIIARVG